MDNIFYKFCNNDIDTINFLDNIKRLINKDSQIIKIVCDDFEEFYINKDIFDILQKENLLDHFLLKSNSLKNKCNINLENYIGFIKLNDYLFDYLFNDLNIVEYKVNETNQEIITLCGNLRFKDLFLEQFNKLTLEGKVVLTPIFSKRLNLNKENFVKIHNKKIEISDSILVINPNNYIGNDTRNEIEYARKLNKKINYLFNEEEN